MTTAEQARLDQYDGEQNEPWRAWVPYLSELAWGTVR